MNKRPVLLVVGDFSDERIDLGGLCSQIGWNLKMVPSLSHLSFNEETPFAAGLIDASPDGGAYLRVARQLLPEVLWIACCRFSARCSWTEMERMGAFHFLHRPLRSAEFLHALGFVDAVMAQRERMEADFKSIHAA